MSWQSEWKAISDRIDSILKAGNYYAQFGSSSDGGGAAHKGLIPSAREIRTSIVEFKDKYGQLLPVSAASCLDKFISDAPNFFEKSDVRQDAYLFARVTLTFLSAFRANFVYKITDVSARALRLSERAFSHLQRSIVADPTIRSKWQAAFEEGETACEKLGAVHLLQHGIWAFKVKEAGEATDLVFGDPLGEDYLSEVECTSEALVLTEWKRVKASEQSKLKEIREKAITQASLYKEGVLGGLELAGYRYIVIVSEDYIPMPPDLKDDNNITYRHRNIAVKRETPSKVAITQAGKTQKKSL
jgi:hypothetical protein